MQGNTDQNNSEYGHLVQYFTQCNIFNDFLSKQCQPVPNNSTLPSIQTSETSKRLSTVGNIDSKKILKLIQDLNSNRALAHGGISIRMLKLCELSIRKPLSLLFNKCLRDRFSLKIGKKQMLFQCIKKGINNQ